MQITVCYPQFFTATILEWKHLLKENKYKQIIIDSMDFLVMEKRVFIYAFVIMPNHMHLIWQIQGGNTLDAVQRDFLKFTAQQIKFDLHKTNAKLLSQFKVNSSDRQYQFWERRPLSINLYSEKVLLQKLHYIHNNPVQDKWQLCKYPEEYWYSSARFYYRGKDDWGFLTHYLG